MNSSLAEIILAANNNMDEEGTWDWQPYQNKGQKVKSTGATPA